MRKGLHSGIKPNLGACSINRSTFPLCFMASPSTSSLHFFPSSISSITPTLKLAIVAILVGFASSTFASAYPNRHSGVLAGPPPPGTKIEVYPDGLPADLIANTNGASLEEQGGQGGPGAHICTEAHFQGYCAYITSPADQCCKYESSGMFSGTYERKSLLAAVSTSK